MERKRKEAAFVNGKGGTTNLAVFVNDKQCWVCNWGGIEKWCRICKWDGRGNKPGYIRKNKFIIEEGSTNSAGFVNGTEGRTNLSLGTD